MRNELAGIALIGADSLIRDLGGDVDHLIAEAGLPPETFLDPDVIVPLHTGMQFIELAADRLECPDFGLRLAQRQDLSVLGPLYLMMLTAETVGDALQMLAQYLRLQSMGLIIVALPVPEGMLIEYDFSFREPGQDRNCVELGLGLLANFIRARTRRDWRPVYAQFRHGRPRDIRLHQQFFGSHLMFDQECSAICLDKATLTAPIHPAGSEARSVAIRMMRRRDAFEAGSILPRAEGTIRAQLAYGNDCSIEKVAATLGFSVRSLQRGLAAAGTGFEAMRDAIRAELARKYLLHSSMSVTEIADVLGFAQPSALTRAFQRWYKASPLQYKKRFAGTPVAMADTGQQSYPA